MTQISNSESFTLIVHSGYEDRLSISGLKASKKCGMTNIEDVLETFVDIKNDSESPYIIALSTVSGEIETYGPLADTYTAIRSDLSTLKKIDQSIINSHICVGNVTLATAIYVMESLNSPRKFSKHPAKFWVYISISSMEIKTSASGRKFIIIKLGTQDVSK